jgi:hypothetical protein
LQDRSNNRAHSGSQTSAARAGFITQPRRWGRRSGCQSQTSAARAGFITRAGRSRPDATPEGPQRQPLGQASSPARRSSGSPKRQPLGQASSLCDVARTREADVVPKRQPLGQASSHRSNRSVGRLHHTGRIVAWVAVIAVPNDSRSGRLHHLVVESVRIHWQPLRQASSPRHYRGALAIAMMSQTSAV